MSAAHSAHDRVDRPASRRTDSAHAEKAIVEIRTTRRTASPPAGPARPSRHAGRPGGRRHDTSAERRQSQHDGHAQPDGEAEIGRRTDPALVIVGRRLFGGAEVTADVGLDSAYVTERVPRGSDHDRKGQRGKQHARDDPGQSAGHHSRPTGPVSRQHESSTPPAMLG